MDGRILITGGAGFLGRAILRKALVEGWDARFTIVSRDETKQNELMRRYGRQLEIRCFLSDVAQGGSEGVANLARLMAGHDIVIHAAAVKYIPEAELNRWECERINVQGSKNVCLAATIAGVQTVVGISTDKAVEPINTYGKTKAIMEDLFAEADTWPGPTRFLTVRYGNVVGSTGSVIPFFTRQVDAGEPITITDQAMSRFWLPPDGAVVLIDEAVSLAPEWHGGTVVNACPAQLIMETAQAVLLASDREITFDEYPIRLIGRRPGEKLAEALLSQSEAETRAHWLPGFQSFVVTHPGMEAREGRGRPEHAYRSDAPRESVTVSEMAEWIEDAREI